MYIFVNKNHKKLIVSPPASLVSNIWIAYQLRTLVRSGNIFHNKSVGAYLQLNCCKNLWHQSRRDNMKITVNIKVMHLDGVLHKNCFYYYCVMHMQLVETVISREQTIQFPVVKCSKKR